MLGRGVAARVLARRLRRLQRVPLALSLTCSSHRLCSTTTANAPPTCSNALATRQDRPWHDMTLHTHTLHAATPTERSSLVRWWQTHYSPAFFAQDDDSSSNHSRTPCNVSSLLPSDMDDMLSFMQALLHGIGCLRAAPTEAEERVSGEMRAVLMYMAQHRLYSVLTSTLPCEAAEQTSHDVSTDASVTCNTLQRRSEEAACGATVVRRSPHERIRENTLMVSAADLARAEQTIELVCAIGASAQPTRRVKDALYCSVLYLMQLCEQLSAQALASSATCLARCWESHAFAQELQHEEYNDTHDVDNNDDEMDEDGDVIHAIRRHLRPCTGASSDVHVCRLSAAEEEEQDEARRAGRAGNALSAITPVSVIGHVHILTMALRRRMNAVYMEDVTQEQPQRKENDRQRSKACASECYADEWQASRDAARRQLAATRAVLGLCSLQERKRREQQQQQQELHLTITCSADECGSERVTPPSPRGRRTIAQLIAAKEQQQQKQKQQSEVSSTNRQSSTRHTTFPPRLRTRITLAEVGEVCTAVASMHYGEAEFWSAVMHFTCRSISHTAQSACINSAQQRAQQDAQYMRHVRSVLFALDYVGQSGHYDKVIAALLRAGLVQGPVPPPPSHTRHAMRHITPSSSSSQS